MLWMFFFWYGELQFAVYFDDGTQPSSNKNQPTKKNSSTQLWEEVTELFLLFSFKFSFSFLFTKENTIYLLKVEERNEYERNRWIKKKVYIYAQNISPCLNRSGGTDTLICMHFVVLLSFSFLPTYSFLSWPLLFECSEEHIKLTIRYVPYVFWNMIMFYIICSLWNGKVCSLFRQRCSCYRQCVRQCVADVSKHSALFISRAHFFVVAVFVIFFVRYTCLCNELLIICYSNNPNPLFWSECSTENTIYVLWKTPKWLTID